jgi:hypothetical protein
MQELRSLVTRAYHSTLAFTLALAYRSNHQTFLGITLARWIKTVTLVPILVTLVQGYGIFATVLAVSLFLWVRIVYWRARLNGYIQFVPDSGGVDTGDQPPPLAADQRVRSWATGTFRVNGEGEYLMLRPAEYWQVPLGDHIIMARVGKDRFKYRILEPESVRELRLGSLLFSTRLRHSLAVTFIELQMDDPSAQFVFTATSRRDMAPGREQTMYLTFENELHQRTVWHNLTRNMRGV